MNRGSQSDWELQAYFQEQDEELAEEDRLFREACEREYAAKLEDNPYFNILRRQMDARDEHQKRLQKETDPARRESMQKAFDEMQAAELRAAHEYNQKKRDEAALQLKERRDAEEARRKEAEAERTNPQALYAEMNARAERLRGQMDARDEHQEHLKKETN